MNLIHEAKNIFETQIKSLVKTMNSIDESFVKLIKLIQNSKGRVIITGMGKAGHISRKIASTMSSLGTTAYYLHPAEGLHGDLGGIMKNDIVIAFSKSGESDEVLGLIPSIKKIGAKLVSVCIKKNSSLTRNADLKVFLEITEEASNNKLAPTSSTTAMLVFGDALAVSLEKLNDFKPEDFAIFHPNGLLGKKLLLKVESLMVEGSENPKVNQNKNIKDSIIEMSSKGMGGVNVIDDEGKLVGLFTDGDLRRLIEKSNDFNFFKLLIKDVMTKNPLTVKKNIKITELLKIMENRKKPLSIMPVVNDDDKSIGMIRIHDIIRAGIK